MGWDDAIPRTAPRRQSVGARPTSPPDPENLLEVAGARNPSDLSTGKEKNWWAAGRTIPWVGDPENGKKYSPYPPTPTPKAMRLRVARKLLWFMMS